MLADGVERVNRRAARAAARSLRACRRASRRRSGTAISADAPPDSSTSSVSPGAVDRASFKARRPACSLASVGTGWLPATSGEGASPGSVVMISHRDPRTQPACGGRSHPHAPPCRPRDTRSGLAGRDRCRSAASASGVASASKRAIDQRDRHRPHQWRPGQSPGDRVGGGRADESVVCFGIGPGGEPGHDVEFLEEGADQFVGVVLASRAARAAPMMRVSAASTSVMALSEK